MQIWVWVCCPPNRSEYSSPSRKDGWSDSAPRPDADRTHGPTSSANAFRSSDPPPPFSPLCCCCCCCCCWSCSWSFAWWCEARGDDDDDPFAFSLFSPSTVVTGGGDRGEGSFSFSSPPFSSPTAAVAIASSGSMGAGRGATLTSAHVCAHRAYLQVRGRVWV